MKYSYLTFQYKDRQLEYIKTNNQKIEQMLCGDNGDLQTVIKAQPEELSRSNVLDWVCDNLSYNGMKIISHSENIFRIPDVATKTVHTFLLDE